MAYKNYRLANLNRKSLNDGSSDWWTVSGGGTSEYYYNQADLPLKPLEVYEGATKLTEGTLGSLASGEWAWGDNDGIGHDCLYVRTTDDADPDSKAAGTMTASAPILLYQHNPTLPACVRVVLEVNNPTTPQKDVYEIRTDSSDNVYLKAKIQVPEYDLAAPKYPVATQPGDKIYIQSAEQQIQVSATVNEISSS